MRPVSVYAVVQPNLIATPPTPSPYPGRGSTEPILGNPVHGFESAVVAAAGAPQGFSSSGTTAPNYGGLAGPGGGSGAPVPGTPASTGACGCG